MGPDLNSLHRHGCAVYRTRHVVALCLAVWWLCLAPARAAIQFDVFPGYDGVVPFAAWFPVVCEVRNDEASFSGAIVLTPGTFGQGAERRLSLELPSGTMKRVVLPAFSISRALQSWDVRLIDNRGRVRAEVLEVQPRRQPGPLVPIMGTLSRTAAGSPTFKSSFAGNPATQPQAVELLPSLFPDTPLVLEGLDTLYLNSERASDVKPAQVQAILTWLEAGGHLIVGLEQAADFVSSPWLKNLTGLKISGSESVEHHGEIHAFICGEGWNTNFFVPGTYNPTSRKKQFNPDENTFRHPFEGLEPDAAFEAAPLRVMTGDLGLCRTVLSVSGRPVVVSIQKGRGTVTCLLANPEREPMRSWKHLPIFWSCLAAVPLQFYSEQAQNMPGGWSSDALYGSLIETRQVRKLPLGWLLLLLVVYLAVIGPLDRYWLKRLGRPSLTWITFPCYVLLFSALIYFIGFKLRAGESEWGELNIVDVFPGKADRALWRGRTYGSIYSPVNQKYPLASVQHLAALRSEFSGSWGGQAATDPGTVSQVGEGFRAEVSVPVWSSRLFVADWYEEQPTSIKSRLWREGGDWVGEVENLTTGEFSRVMIAVGEAIYELGPIGAREKKPVRLAVEQGTKIGEYVVGFNSDFNLAATYRRRAFGQGEMRLANGPAALAIAASFLQHPGTANRTVYFQQSPGLEVTPYLREGGAVVFAWAQDQAPFASMLRFTPRRVQRHTLWREFIMPESKPALAEAPAAKPN